MSDQSFLGVDLPIIQAPMAGVQDSELAIAVSSAGGLGSLPCSMLSPDALHAELTLIKSKTSQPINVNFFCHTTPKFDAEREQKWRLLLQPYFEEYEVDINDIPTDSGRKPFSHAVADVLEEFKPEVVSFHFGLPQQDLLKRIKSWGAKVISSATTVEEARWLEANGADGIIAQGFEAGGHRGMFLSEELSLQTGTFELLPKIIREVNLPVIATGGITDAKEVAAALSVGAAAVQIGTAYLLCSETKTSRFHRAAIKSDSPHQTEITNIFSGRPARGIVNRGIRELGPINPDVPQFPLATAAITALRKQVELRGCDDFSPLWCGKNIDGCKEVSAADLTSELASLIE
ncbi:MAG: nitronate monooxygenase [Pseudomonadales bacterium]|nr:nitronate monooxygenase [Pseudomonadales bacterium]